MKYQENVMHENSVIERVAGEAGPRIVRSWFDTVINPLLQNLGLEKNLLQEKNWTWTVPPGKLESIRPIKEMGWNVIGDSAPH